MCIKMVLISQFIFLTVVILTFQEVFSNLCESNEYSSPFANYHKLLGDPAAYNSWASMCQDLGVGWDVARVNDTNERWFIEQAHLSAYDQRAYWIAGMSDRAPGTSLFPQSLSDSGTYHAHSGTNLGFFTSFTIEGSAKLPGILCEQVLGPGWAPAFLETFREIDFLREAQRRFFNSDNIQEYWIAGTVDLNTFVANRQVTAMLQPQEIILCQLYHKVEGLRKWNHQGIYLAFYVKKPRYEEDAENLPPFWLINFDPFLMTYVMTK